LHVQLSQVQLEQSPVLQPSQLQVQLFLCFMMFVFNVHRVDVKHLKKMHFIVTFSMRSRSKFGIRDSLRCFDFAQHKRFTHLLEGQKVVLCLHISTILSSYFKQCIGNLTKRALFTNLH
jgi:hypothetical protein